jgi:hypothetical protein
MWSYPATGRPFMAARNSRCARRSSDRHPNRLPGTTQARDYPLGRGRISWRARIEFGTRPANHGLLVVMEIRLTGNRGADQYRRGSDGPAGYQRPSAQGRTSAPRTGSPRPALEALRRYLSSPLNVGFPRRLRLPDLAPLYVRVWAMRGGGSPPGLPGRAGFWRLGCAGVVPVRWGGIGPVGRARAGAVVVVVDRRRLGAEPGQ